MASNYTTTNLHFNPEAQTFIARYLDKKLVITTSVYTFSSSYLNTPISVANLKTKNFYQDIGFVCFTPSIIEYKNYLLALKEFCFTQNLKNWILYLYFGEDRIEIFQFERTKELATKLTSSREELLPYFRDILIREGYIFREDLLSKFLIL